MKAVFNIDVVGNWLMWWRAFMVGAMHATQKHHCAYRLYAGAYRELCRLTTQADATVTEGELT